MIVRFLAFAAAAAVVVSCASTQSAIPVAGQSADLSRLAGEWSGDYHARGGGRQGLVTFKLSAGADTARGEVLMFPRERSETRPTTETRVVTPPPPQPLSIAFVRTQKGAVSGSLDPYRDPDCDCEVTTVFEGMIRGDTIEGTYVSHRSNNLAPQQGEWKVRRRKS